MPKIEDDLPVFEFAVDYTKSNPALHRLHVAFALEVLKDIDDAIDKLNEHSKVQAHMAASALIDVKSQFIKEDSAYRDAAALRSSGQFELDPNPLEEPAEKVEVNHA